jgi:hypothetical protein
MAQLVEPVELVVAVMGGQVLMAVMALPILVAVAVVVVHLQVPVTETAVTVARVL